MLITANITMQFGPKPLFENVSVKFGDGNRYGLIGANGCGKSTFMKILGNDLEPTSGNVSKDPNERIGKLKQDQFAYEKYKVIDTVIMGHEELWAIKSEKDAIYANPEMTEADGIRAGDLEAEFAEMDGYSAEARAGELLLGLGIPSEQHYGPMSEVAPGWKLRVLLAQALFSEPDIMLLDEPTNNLDINSIRWLEDILNERKCTMIIISHDRHFLNSVCTHMADLDYGEIRMYPGSYDEYMIASTQVTERLQADNAKKKAQIAELKSFVSRFSANASKSKQATSRAKQIDKIQLAEVKPSSRQNPYIRFEEDKKLHRLALEVEGLAKSYDEKYLAGAVFRVSPDLTLEKYSENSESVNLLYYRESLYQNVMVQSDGVDLVLRLDGKPQCNTRDSTTTGLINLAYVPFQLYLTNYEQPQTGLNIGLGCGITSVVMSKNLNTTTIEIDPAVVEANKFFFDSIDHRLIIDDARNWLLRNNEKFDIITSEPTDPWMSWNLHTKEYFEILSNHVTENGVVAQWIPVYELHDKNLLIMYNTFHSVFPYVYVYSMEPGEDDQLIFVGSQYELKIEKSEGYLFNQYDVQDVKTELNTDNKPIIEFTTANSLYDRSTQSIEFPFNNEEIYEKFNALN